jgi:DNA-binding MarR family transcriptional regulator
MAVPQESPEVAAPLVPGTIAEHTSCVLLKVGQVLFRLTEARLAALGLRTRHYSILQALIDAGSMSQQDLGTYLRIDPATMVASVDDLERLTLATRTRSQRDRRRYVVAVTDQGREIADKVNAVLAQLDEEVMADLTPQQRDQLRQAALELTHGPTLPRAFDAIRGS